MYLFNISIIEFEPACPLLFQGLKGKYILPLIGLINKIAQRFVGILAILLTLSNPVRIGCRKLIAPGY